MGNIFESVQLTAPKYSMFDLSHDVKTTLNMGDLVPIYLQETIPGDNFTFGSEVLARCQAMVAPVMHKVDLYVHYFYVPNRILWKNWRKFIDPPGITGASDAVPPTLMNGAVNTTIPGTLPDYMGIPLHDFSLSGEPISALPFAA